MEKNCVYILHPLTIRIQGSLVNSLFTADLSETTKRDPDLPDQDKVKKTLILTCSIAKPKSKPWVAYLLASPLCRSRCPGSPLSETSNRETDECSMQYEHIISLPVYPRVSVSLWWVFLDVLCISYIFGWKSRDVPERGSFGRNRYPPSKINRLFWGQLWSEMNWESFIRWAALFKVNCPRSIASWIMQVHFIQYNPTPSSKISPKQDFPFFRFPHLTAGV